MPVLAQDTPTAQQMAAEHGTFESYWYQGAAEMDRYALSQARYGEVHPGEAVLIYVTEDFLSDAQVKWDHGPRDNVVPILKLNHARRFYTGIYPYSIMTSVFSPTAGGSAIKLTASIQEWCGMAFAQLNLHEDSYRAASFSYFQSEGDSHSEIPNAILEDELWVIGRRDPRSLPVGAIEVIPSLAFVRLMHQPLLPVQANASLEEVGAIDSWDGPILRYTVEFPEGRSLTLDFEVAFPNRIVRFEEAYTALFNRSGGDPEVLSTTGVLTHSIMMDYWSHNALENASDRDLLGLEY